jgi:hypothetical protein
MAAKGTEQNQFHFIHFVGNPARGSGNHASDMEYPTNFRTMAKKSDKLISLQAHGKYRIGNDEM